MSMLFPRRAGIFVGLVLSASLANGQNSSVPPTVVRGTEGETPSSENPPDDDTQVVRAFFQDYCVECHGETTREGGLALHEVATWATVGQDYELWRLLRQRISRKEMPPAESDSQPSQEARQQIVNWIDRGQQRQAIRQAGDPGLILARRLSGAEYDYTIADLTGVDIRPSREFPVDPANAAGFDNTGESLTMSPTLLKKYLQAARRVADHAVLLPDGLSFAPHPMIAETDRDKYCVLRIADFYQRHSIDYKDYFMSLVEWRRQASAPVTSRALNNWGVQHRLSAKYLITLESALQSDAHAVGPLALLQSVLLPLETQTTLHENDLATSCGDLRDLIVDLRGALVPTVEAEQVRGMSPGSQPLVLLRNRTVANQRLKYAGNPIDDYSRLREIASKWNPDYVAYFDVDPSDADRVEIAREELSRFCAIFPDEFFVAQRGPYFAPDSADQQRLLTAGFHLMQGYFRDDGPLCNLILDDHERRELDRLWTELDFITGVPLRQYQDFIFFERAEPPRFMFGAEFDFARSEDQNVASPEKMHLLHERHVAKAKANDASERALQAISEYYAEMAQRISAVDAARRAAEPSHLVSLIEFASRAWRRPLRPAERTTLLQTYRSLRNEQMLAHEDAVRDTLATLLLSPKFCFRVAANPSDPADEANTVRMLDSHELASRLSYFLWSSMPDDELRARADDGTLLQSKTLIAQTGRMLHDQRNRRFATEFLANLLETRRFEEHHGVDREQFPQFDESLRSAMFAEPIHFFRHCIEQNRPLMELVTADYTYVNRPLAEHYGIPPTVATDDAWIRIDEAGRFGRGGLLPMAVFLTKNSPGLRTSPVKRGYWVVRRLLGEYIPPPPAKVPELPQSEVELSRSLAETLASHRADRACAVCHDRFDAVGLVFEGYGPIGEVRDHDLGGRPIDNAALFPDGSTRAGLAGLESYIVEQREAELVDHLLRKLVSYAFGRSLIASDELLLTEMKTKLAPNKYPIGSLIEMIVISAQFRQTRVSKGLTHD